MSAPLSIADTIGRVDAAVSGQTGGQRFPLGMTYDVPAKQADNNLYAVNSDGTVETASFVGSRLYTLASGEAWVINPANCGKQRWIYVYNDSGSTIQRGATCVSKAATAAYHVKVGGAANAGAIIGVAQHDIATASWGWILREGVGEVLANGSVTADATVEPAAAGTVTDVAATTDESIGVAFDTDAGASTLVTARLFCRG